MADTFGSLLLPAPIPASGKAVTDPLLDVVLAFAAGCLTDQLTTAWQARCPGQPIVRSTFALNPNEHGISSNAFPALYGWRSKFGPTKRAASDWYLRDSTISLMWVPEPTATDRQAAREPIINGIDAAISDALESVGRTPGWVVSGDTDPRAEDEGSSLWKYTRLHRIELASTQWGTLTVETANQKLSPFMRVVLMNLDLTERKVRDPAVHADADYGITGGARAGTDDMPLPFISLVDPNRPEVADWLPILETDFPPA